jgi:hypothetical protein
LDLQFGYPPFRLIGALPFPVGTGALGVRPLLGTIGTSIRGLQFFPEWLDGLPDSLPDDRDDVRRRTTGLSSGLLSARMSCACRLCFVRRNKYPDSPVIAELFRPAPPPHKPLG